MLFLKHQWQELRGQRKIWARVNPFQVDQWIFFNNRLGILLYRVASSATEMESCHRSGFSSTAAMTWNSEFLYALCLCFSFKSSNDLKMKDYALSFSSTKGCIYTTMFHYVLAKDSNSCNSKYALWAIARNSRKVVFSSYAVSCSFVSSWSSVSYAAINFVSFNDR